MDLQELRKNLFTQENFGKGTEALKNALLNIGFTPIATQEERKSINVLFNYPFTQSLNPKLQDIYERAKLFVEAWSWFNGCPVSTVREYLNFDLPPSASTALLEISPDEILKGIKETATSEDSTFFSVASIAKPLNWTQMAIDTMCDLTLKASGKFGIVSTGDVFDPKKAPDALLLMMDFTKGLDRIVPYVDIQIPPENRQAFSLLQIYSEALKVLDYSSREINEKLMHFYNTGSFNEILQAVTEAYRKKGPQIAKEEEKNPQYPLGKQFLIPALWTAAVMNSDIELVYLPFVFDYLISIQNAGFVPISLENAEALRGAAASRNITLATRNGTYFNTGLSPEILRQAINLMPYAISGPRGNPLIDHTLAALSQRLNEIVNDPNAQPLDVQDFMIAGLQGFANLVKDLWENRFTQSTVTGLFIDPNHLNTLSQNIGEFSSALGTSGGVFFVPYDVKDEKGKTVTKVMLIVPSSVTPIFTSYQNWLPSGQKPPIEFSLGDRVFRTNVDPTIVSAGEIGQFLYNRTGDPVTASLIGDILGRIGDNIFIFDMGILLPNAAAELTASAATKGFLEGNLKYWTVNPNFTDREYSLVTAVAQDAGTPWRLPKSDIPQSVKSKLESLGPIPVDYGPSVTGINQIIFSFDPDKRAQVVQQIVDTQYSYLPEVERQKQMEILMESAETNASKALRFLYILSSYKPEIWRCPGYLPIPQVIPNDIQENASPEFLATYRKAASKAYERLQETYQDPTFASMKRNWIELMKVLLAPVFSPELVERFASAVGPGESIWDAFVDDRIQTYGTAKPFVKAVVEAWDEASSTSTSTPLLTKTWFKQYWDAARSAFQSFTEAQEKLNTLGLDTAFWLEFSVLDPTEALANLQGFLDLINQMQSQEQSQTGTQPAGGK